MHILVLQEIIRLLEIARLYKVLLAIRGASTGHNKLHELFFQILLENTADSFENIMFLCMMLCATAHNTIDEVLNKSLRSMFHLLIVINLVFFHPT